MTAGKIINAYIQMSRPLNILIAFISIWIAAIISPAYYFNWRIVLASLTAVFMTSAANVINDIFDIEIDRINKPQRLLAAGTITLRTAWTFTFISYALAISLALLCGWRMFFVAVLIGFLLAAYSTHLKRTVLWGNLAVSFSTAVAFIYGAMAVNDWQAGLIPAIFAFWFHLGREIIKDLQDVEGDLAGNAVTFAGRYGRRRAIALTNIIFIVLILLTMFPYIFSIYNHLYLYVVLLGVDFVLIGVIFILNQQPDKKILGYISHVLKLDMLIGLVAIYLGT